jgi:hypothetical protein
MDGQGAPRPMTLHPIAMGLRRRRGRADRSSPTVCS